MITCRYCGKEIKGRHVVDGALHFCTDECADKDWKERGADLYAREMSEGLFLNFEDYAEMMGATVVSHYPEDQLEYLRRREQ